MTKMVEVEFTRAECEKLVGDPIGPMKFFPLLKEAQRRAKREAKGVSSAFVRGVHDESGERVVVYIELVYRGRLEGDEITV